MTIHVNIGQAKTRLSELVAAAVRGERVVLAKAGEPQVELTPLKSPDSLEAIEARRRKRRSALGMWREVLEGVDTTVPPSMTDAQVEERWRRKLGPTA